MLASSRVRRWTWRRTARTPASVTGLSSTPRPSTTGYWTNEGCICRTASSTDAGSSNPIAETRGRSFQALVSVPETGCSSRPRSHHRPASSPTNMATMMTRGEQRVRSWASASAESASRTQSAAHRQHDPATPVAADITPRDASRRPRPRQGHARAVPSSSVASEWMSIRFPNGSLA